VVERPTLSKAQRMVTFRRLRFGSIVPRQVPTIYMANDDGHWECLPVLVIASPYCRCFPRLHLDLNESSCRPIQSDDFYFSVDPDVGRVLLAVDPSELRRNN
jgi:hypothetical protein